jgi:hypothetical protein
MALLFARTQMSVVAYSQSHGQLKLQYLAAYRHHDNTRRNSYAVKFRFPAELFLEICGKFNYTLHH